MASLETSLLKLAKVPIPNSVAAAIFLYKLLFYPFLYSSDLSQHIYASKAFVGMGNLNTEHIKN